MTAAPTAAPTSAGRAAVAPHPDDGLGADLLRRDYDYWAECFWKNEESGERRLQFLITLVTAVMAGLGALFGYVVAAGRSATPALTMDQAVGEAADVVLRVAIPALGGLLLVGIVTFLRMVHRDRVTDDYKERLDQLRRTVYGDLRASWLYDPESLDRFGASRPEPGAAEARRAERGRRVRTAGGHRARRSLVQGGLSTTVAALDGLLAGLIAGLALWKFEGAPTRDASLAGVGAGLATLFLHTLVMRWRMADAREERALRAKWRDANAALVQPAPRTAAE